MTPLSTTFLTSRSAIESYQFCPRSRYLRYLHLGRGIVPARRSIPLTTGTAVHNGIAILLNYMRKNNSHPNYYTLPCPSELVQEAVDLAVSRYLEEVNKSGLAGKGTYSQQSLDYTIAEQSALTEALVRIWAMIEYPALVKRFQVYCVERDVEVELAPGIVMESKPDAVLVQRNGGDVFAYSLKTAKKLARKEELSYRKDLQGVTEILGAEGILKEDQQKLYQLLDTLEHFICNDTIRTKLIEVVNKHSHQHSCIGVLSPNQSTRCSAIKFCFLIKGDRKESTSFSGNDSTTIYETQSPLIRGYRQFSPGGTRYAHSWYFPNPANKSGKGALGKSWESFTVWDCEEVGGVKGWIEKLVGDASLQPEYPAMEMMKAQCISPLEWYRNDKEVQSTLVQIRQQELEVSIKANRHRLKKIPTSLDRRFPQYRRSCDWPVPCDYKPICWGEDERGNGVPVEVQEDPIGSGWFELREPHHRMEKERFELLVNNDVMVVEP